LMRLSPGSETFVAIVSIMWADGGENPAPSAMRSAGLPRTRSCQLFPIPVTHFAQSARPR
jgi:hypothetical protein